MKYSFVEPLNDEELIYEFEEKIGYKFSQDFISFVKKYNGGMPDKVEFDTEVRKRHCLGCFLSFNKNDMESIWDSCDYETEYDNLVPFADDAFGNLICFEKETGHVVFWDHELDETEYICENFSQFLKCLY